jgi:uncharacterized cupredoxin-like copper-binding protein
MRPRIVVPALTAAIVAIAPACTSASHGDTNARSDTRTLDIEMHDIAFSPSHITVPTDEPVRLVFHNLGSVPHDAFIGDARAQMGHEEMMSSMASMGGMDHGNEHGHDDGLTVRPGETGTLTHTFEAGDDVLIGCHEPGHYDAGMKLTVTTS